MTSRRPAFEGCLQELDNAPQISADSRLVARPHLVYLLHEEGDKLVILFGSTQITLPSFTREAVAFALSGQPFSVSDLPGALDEAGKIVLARRLIKEGMLVQCEQAGPRCNGSPAPLGGAPGGDCRSPRTRAARHRRDWRDTTSLGGQAGRLGREGE